VWFDYKPVDVEIDDDDAEISYVFEMWIGINEKFRPERGFEF